MKPTQHFSLKSLVALGFIAPVMPLLAAVLYAAIAMRETAAMGRDMDTQTFEQTKAVRLVSQKTADIERKARLFVLLADPALRRPYERKSYEAARGSFRQALGELLKLPLDNEVALLANELSEKEGLIYQQIVGSEADKHPRLPVDEAFLGLREASNTLSRAFESHVDHQFHELRQQAETREHALLTKVGVLLGVSIACLGLLLAFLGRSMRQLDSSLRRLESGNLADPIHLAGSSDLRRMGGILESLRTRLLELEASKQAAMEEASSERETHVAVTPSRRMGDRPPQEPYSQQIESPLPQPMADEA